MIIEIRHIHKHVCVYISVYYTDVCVYLYLFLYVCTFLVSHVHGPLCVFTEVIYSFDDAVWISPDCISTDGLQEALRDRQAVKQTGSLSTHFLSDEDLASGNNS